MLTVATLIWHANKGSRSFSTMYTEEWVEKLYRGFARNLTRPFHFVCYTDRVRSFVHPEIGQRKINTATPSYADCVQPYELNTPMILVGLDTIICGNCDALADYCFEQAVLALPRDPYNGSIACNGVALVPAGYEEVARNTNRQNDMERVRGFAHTYIDDFFPNKVLSFKVHYKDRRHLNPSIVYFHGDEKPHELMDDPLVREHWL